MWCLWKSLSTASVFSAPFGIVIGVRDRFISGGQKNCTRIKKNNCPNNICCAPPSVGAKRRKFWLTASPRWPEMALYRQMKAKIRSLDNIIPCIIENEQNNIHIVKFLGPVARIWTVILPEFFSAKKIGGRGQPAPSPPSRTPMGMVEPVANLNTF